jgi:hypothetical protein
MRSDRGQGTVEYLAVVLLVGLVLGGGSVAVARSAGADVATAVPHQVLYAICRVTGGDCDRDRAPCDVGSLTAAHEWTVTVLVLKGGRRRILVRERRSDGTVAVTETTAPLGGVEVVAGSGVRIRLRGRTLTLGGSATVSALAALGRGRTWVVDGEQAADALVAGLRAGGPVRPPDQRLAQIEASLDGALSGGQRRVTLAGGVGVAGVVGRSTDRATGTITYFVEGGVRGDATVSLPALRASAAGQGADRERYALTVDRDGRWLDLATVRTGEVSGTVTLAPQLRPVADALNVPTPGGRRWVAETHLDLSDPVSSAAAHDFLSRLQAVPPNPLALGRATVALSRRLDERGVVDVRSYALARTDSGLDVHVGASAGVGGAIHDTTEQTRLIAAATRGLDGQWRRRDDCTQEA